MLTNTCKALAKHWLSRHHPMSFLSHVFLAYIYNILDKVFIQTSSLTCEVYIEVSLLHSLPIMVCKVADNVVCQVTILPSFNSL